MTATTTSPSQPPDSARRTDLDALRGIAMLLGIVLHACLSYFPCPWPVQDTRQNPLFFMPYEVIHMFRMPLFFIISGFFTMFILQRHGIGGMIRQRVERIFIPLMLALLTIVPVDNMLTREGQMMRVQDPSKKTPLVRAILSGDQTAIMRQLNMGDYVNQEDPAYGLMPLCWASLAGNDKTVSYLLDRGANVRAADKEGNTPLHEAALFCHPSTVRLLLDHGAEPSAKNNYGWTPAGYCGSTLGLKRAMAEKLGLILSPDQELRIRMGETMRSLSPRTGATSFSSWLDRVVTNYRAFLVSDGFLIRVGGHSLHLFDEEILDHLWFLWLLLWLVAGLSLAIRVGFSPTGRLLWCIPPLTVIPQAFMGSAVGPDLWFGPIPPPHLLLYYGLFFWFGAAVFSRDGMATRMGKGWQILLPLGLLILFPTALKLIAYREAGSIVQCAYAWVVSLGVMGLFARYCSQLGYRARWLSDSAYWMYLVHLPLVLAAQILLVRLPWPPLVKFFLVMAMTTLLLLLSYQWLVRYTWIGTLLNGPRKPSSPSPLA